MNGSLLSSVFLALVVGGALIVWYWVPKRQRFKRFENREDLDLEEIYAKFFADHHLPKPLVWELWSEVAAPLRLPPGKLRPTDRFDQELAPPKGWEWDDEILDVYCAARRRLRKLGISADLSGIKTLGDYVDFFCKLQSERTLT